MTGVIPKKLISVEHSIIHIQLILGKQFEFRHL